MSGVGIGACAWRFGNNHRLVDQPLDARHGANRVVNAPPFQIAFQAAGQGDNAVKHLNIDFFRGDGKLPQELCMNVVPQIVV